LSSTNSAGAIRYGAIDTESVHGTRSIENSTSLLGGKPGTSVENTSSNSCTTGITNVLSSFSTSSTEATKSCNLILDRCLLFDNNVLVLFDSRATHSFISQECVSRLGLVIQDLGYELAVSTPVSGEVFTNLVCAGCPTEVAGHKFKVNLIWLPLEGLDVILGMDWLSDNHVIMDYRRRSVVFPEADG